MTKFIFPLFLCAASLFSLTPLQARHVFKKYLTDKEITFRDGHFRIARPGKPLLKLKTLRANNAGIYYIPKDVCKKKGLHRDHDNNRDSDILSVEKKHGGCKNRPQHTAPIPRPPYRTPSRPALNGPSGRCVVKEVEQESREVTEEKVRRPGRYRPDRKPRCPEVEEFSSKELENSMKKWNCPQGLPETMRHDHYFDVLGANGAAG